jgi:putative ABC transport system permease protein
MTPHDPLHTRSVSQSADALRQDLGDALGSLKANPGFAAVVVAALALGIGASTAVFSVMNAVVFNPLPYERGQDLVRLHAAMPRANVAETNFSVAEIHDMRDHVGSLSSLAELHVMYFILLGRAEPERVSTGVVSANFFRTLGVAPILGRDFRDDDDQRGAPAVLILSHRYWRQSFGGDPAIIGRIFQMNDRPHTVIGVLPPLPEYPEEASVFMPTSACPFRSNPTTEQTRTTRFLTAFARVVPELHERVDGDLDVVAHRLQASEPAAYPERAGYQLSAESLNEAMIKEFRPTMAILLATAAFLLLVLCCSVAALLLARVLHREREITLRAVMGATRARLFRQFVAEHLVLSVVGAGLGLLIAMQSLGLLRRLAGQFTSRADGVAIDGRVLLFLAGITIGTSLLFGTITTLASRATPALLLRNADTRTGSARTPFRHALVVVQIAVCFALLAGAGLTIRSLMNMQHLDTGLRTDNVLTMRVPLDFIKHPTPANRATVYTRLLGELGQLPGVEAVAAAGTVPLNEIGSVGGTPVFVEGQDTHDRNLPPVSSQVVSPDYFGALGVALRDGRPFAASDDLSVAPVAMVNESFAKRYWPDGHGVGRRIRFDATAAWITVVGVVSDARQRIAAEVGDQVFRPLLQQPLGEARLFVRSAVPPDTMQKQVREAMRRVDPQQPVDSVATLDEVRDRALASPRLTATLLAVIAVIALGISTVGIAGVVSFSVNQRAREFGTLMAIGMDRGFILRMVLKQGALLAAAGIALGLLGALALGRLMSPMLFGVGAADPLTLAAVAVALFLVAIAATLEPARRASRVDPMVALRAT